MRRIAAATLIRGSGALFGPVLGLVMGVLATVLPAQAGVVVTISKSQQRLAVMVDGTELYRWPISTGRPGLETPSGAFRPIRLERTWYSGRYDGSPMPYSIFFHGGYAVHGTYETRRLGRPVSHGCVRLSPGHAATLFSLVRRQGKGNARIVVTSGPLPPASDGASIAEIRKPRPAPSPSSTPKRETVVEVVPRAARREISRPPPRHVKRRVVVPRTVHVRAEDRFVSAGDDAAVMRGRDAWLRSLDRQYGIAH